MSAIEEIKTKFHHEFKLASTHRFTQELCDGTLPDRILYTYLKQDLKFFLVVMRFISRTMSVCDDDDALITLGKQVGFFCNDENNYFRDTLAELEENNNDLPEAMRKEPADELPRVTAYLKHFEEWTGPNADYVTNITALYMAELSYLMWAENQGGSEEKVSKLKPKHKGWIDLHRGVGFSKWVDFLGAEVERLIKKDPKNKETVHKIVKLALGFEYEFFEECYTYAG
ncbi:Pet18 protein [Starmerella bacillaris]|uniref:Pet18 protein n=1 Tax=Starmerella bacillaris TaxID=1247836 RepID=A0AAV5RDP3_STABA|nr:Pet18 protein [Starmerella bacillaris]